jgi:sulfur-carrier protein adenylyltransferase/sulfurtransferase
VTSYRDLLRAARESIEEVDATSAQELLAADDAPVLVDVRERDEWEQGRIAGAVHVPRGHLESKIEAAAPDRSRAVLLYCSAGNRSAFAAKTLSELGYERPISLAGGYNDWQRSGLPTDLPRTLGPARTTRYSRHLLIPEVGEEGQLRLLDSSILLVGAGGLGSPAALYLAAAGVGRIGIVDADVVDETNLQRQIAHSTDSLGEPKTDSARRRIESLNPDVEVVPFRERLTSENIERILEPGWDVIVDGADNFPTRYLVNDASVWHDIPVVHGSIFRFEGQVTVFKPNSGPCYRCLFPQPPPPELAPSCAEGGVLGVLPGVTAAIQHVRCAARARRSPTTWTTSSSAPGWGIEPRADPTDAAWRDGGRPRGRGQRRHHSRAARRSDGPLSGASRPADRGRGAGAVRQRLPRG